MAPWKLYKQPNQNCNRLVGMMLNPRALFVLPLILLLHSCIEIPNDESGPNIYFSGASQGQTVLTGEEVDFGVTCEDDILLERVEFTVNCPLSDWDSTAVYPALR